MATKTDSTTSAEPMRIRQALPDNMWMHVGLIISIVLMALPIILALLMSTQSTLEIYQVSNIGFGSQGLENYWTVLTEYNFGTYMINSLIMSIIIVVGKVTLSLLAALVLVYYELPYERAIFMFILLTLLLPVPVRIVPLFQMMVDLGWINTMYALTLPYIASATAVFLFRQHFMSIPSSLVETARLSGVGPLTFLYKVLIPMSRGMIAGLCVIEFIYAWNQYLWPLVAVTGKGQTVVQVGIRHLQGTIAAGLVQWGLIMAGAILALLPPLIILIVLHRPLLETFTVQQK